MDSCNHHNHHPGYVFGSAIITLVIGSLAFIVALNWSLAINKTFEYYETRSEELKARYSFALVLTAIAIILSFFAMYFIDGQKW